MAGTIAIVGRPNVGKSALFNRIAGRRIAIVHDRPGVTRDRVIAQCEWRERTFTLVDTGGIGLLRGEKAEDVIAEAAARQVDVALESADAILFVVNVRDGLMPLDLEVGRKLRDARRPVIVAANQADDSRLDPVAAAEFGELGFGAPFPTSAIHGRGIEDLLCEVNRHLPAGASVVSDPTPPEPDGAAESSTEESQAVADADQGALRDAERSSRPIKLAIVGRPNVGKSSLINALTGAERVIVSPVPGTTRDAVDVPFDVEIDGRREHYVLIDTAGLRKARKVGDSVEMFSVERTKDAISRCDVAVLVLDAEGGILEQDKKIADIITENRRACLIVVNKWDLVAEDVRKARIEEIEKRNSRDRADRVRRLTTLAEFGDWVRGRLFFLDYAPVIFTSATDGFQLDRLLEAVRFVGSQWRQRAPTSILNRTLADSVERRQPVSKQGRRLKFFYATQTAVAPPTFVLFVNDPTLFTPAYEKFLAGELRGAFGYEGCPLVLLLRERKRTITPKRRDVSQRAARLQSRPRGAGRRPGLKSKGPARRRPAGRNKG